MAAPVGYCDCRRYFRIFASIIFLEVSRMYSEKDITVGSWLFQIFNIFFLKGMTLICGFLGIGAIMAANTRPASGWYTRREYEAEQLGSTIAQIGIVALFIFVVVFFLKWAALIFCTLTWIILVYWVVLTILGALHSPLHAFRYIKDSILGLKYACYINGMAPRAMLPRFIASAVIAFFFMEIVFNPLMAAMYPVIPGIATLWGVSVWASGILAILFL